MDFPEIDYEAHPAYAMHLTASNYDDDLMNDRIRAADNAYLTFCDLPQPSAARAEEALAAIREAVDGIFVHLRQRGIPVVAEEWVHSCARWTLNDIGYEFARRVLSARQHRPVPLAPQYASHLADMHDKGVYIASLPPELYDDIRRHSLLQRDDLKARAISRPFERAVVSVKFASPLWKAIKLAARRSGIIDVLSELKKNQMTILGAGLEYSSANQTWSQNIYADVGLPDSPFQYLHFDEGYCIPKAMIYVTPVEENSGPTRSIPGSHRWRASEFRLRMFRALDRVVSDRYSALSTTGNYRPIARRPELRRIFMQLPRALRGSSHFGDDVVPKSTVATALAGREVQYLSKSAQAFVFDGPHLLHRGSIVQSGERMALQVAFRNRNEANIRSRLRSETFFKEQIALGRKYARKFVMSYL